MRVEFKYSEADYYDANRLQFANSNSKPAALVLGVIFLILAILMLSDARSGYFVALALLEFLVSFYFLTWPFVWLRFKTKYAYRKSANLNAEHIFDISSEEIKTNSPERANGTIYWKAFQKSHRNEKTLLLYTSDRQFVALPRRLFSDSEWAELTSIVDSKVAKA